MNACKPAPPLVVDLDGTLIRTDLLHESALALLRHDPLAALAIPVWLVRGKASMKAEIARRVDIDAATLPYNEPFLVWLRQQHAAGRQLILTTASHRKFAEAVATHLGLFDAVWASDEQTNLAGENKRRRLTAEFGERGFCYAGNASPDLKVWQSAASAVVVNASNGLLKEAATLAPIEHVEPSPRQGVGSWLNALRLHQWLKNLLIFLPLLAAHQFADPARWSMALLAFVSFGLTASSVYLLNDLLDLSDDRHHHSKCRRPFASGQLSVISGVLAAPLLLVVAIGIATFLPWKYSVLLAGYYCLTVAYSFWLKRLVMLDAIVLAALYTARIVAGATAVHISPSFWLLAFSMFIFLSLALLKRYSELVSLRRAGEWKRARGRDYHVEDIELLASLGASAGYGSVLVLALYINSAAVQGLYHEPRLIWFACPLLLYWISRAWIVAHRGEMHDDPVVYAVRD
ncbi:MAG: UbiA family prenyltransferase, partial [Methylococcales bacterium]